MCVHDDEAEVGKEMQDTKVNASLGGHGEVGSIMIARNWVLLCRGLYQFIQIPNRSDRGYCPNLDREATKLLERWP